MAFTRRALLATLEGWRVGKLKRNRRLPEEELSNSSTLQLFNSRKSQFPATRTIRSSAPLFAALLVLAVAAAPASGQATVQQVAVELTFDGPAPHRIIRERLEATVASVAERLLLGRPLDQVTALLPPPEETIARVVERVTAGYAVADAAVRPGIVTTVVVRMRPLGAVVRDVAVISDLRMVHPRVQPLLTALLQPGVVAELQALVTALPVTSFEWAGPLVELGVRDAVEAALPGFTASTRIRPGETTQLDLAILPKDSRVIRNIGVRFRSSSSPIVLLDQHGPQVASMAEPLRGLPVVFA